MFFDARLWGKVSAELNAIFPNYGTCKMELSSMMTIKIALALKIAHLRINAQ